MLDGQPASYSILNGKLIGKLNRHQVWYSILNSKLNGQSTWYCTCCLDWYSILNGKLNGQPAWYYILNGQPNGNLNDPSAW